MTQTWAAFPCKSRKAITYVAVQVIVTRAVVFARVAVTVIDIYKAQRRNVHLSHSIPASFFVFLIF